VPKTTAKERQAKRKAKIRENPESYQSYLRKDRRKEMQQHNQRLPLNLQNIA